MPGDLCFEFGDFGGELRQGRVVAFGELADAADFIQKPVNPQVLRQRVRTQVLLRQRERELVRLQAELDQLKAQLATAMAKPDAADATRPGITEN